MLFYTQMEIPQAGRLSILFKMQKYTKNPLWQNEMEIELSTIYAHWRQLFEQKAIKQLIQKALGKQKHENGFGKFKGKKHSPMGSVESTRLFHIYYTTIKTLLARWGERGFMGDEAREERRNSEGRTRKGLAFF